MADFPVCPSSERTMSVLTPFRRGFMKTGKFYCKVVSASLFADSTAHAIDFTTKIVPSNLFAGIPLELKSCTAQSLSRFAPAPFTQGSLWVYGIRPHSIQRNHQIPNLSLFIQTNHNSTASRQKSREAAIFMRRIHPDRPAHPLWYPGIRRGSPFSGRRRRWRSAGPPAQKPL